MQSLIPSPPFSLAKHDYQELAIGGGLAALAALLAYIGVTVVPVLSDHVANDYGTLIVILLTAFVKWALDVVHRYTTDTSKIVKSLLIAVALTLVCSTSAWAADPSPIINLPVVGTLTWMQWAAIAVAIVMGFLHKDSLASILRSVANVLDPQPGPGPAPSPTPSPTPTPTPSPPPIQDLITQILNIVNQFKKAGNDPAASKAQALLEEAVKVA